MKKEPWRGQNSIRFLYLRYKDSPYYSLFVLFFVLIVSLLLVFQVIIPQVSNWFSIRDEAIATSQRIAVLRSNITFMANLNKNTLENNRQLTVSALPIEKDFGAIINAVAITAVRSGVTVDDFSFSLGQIATSSSQTTIGGVAGLSAVTLSLSLNGGVDRVKTFIQEIAQNLPLSQVDSVDTTNGITSVSLLFYSKPYKTISTPIDQPILPISSENGSLLGTLSSWSSRMSTVLQTNQPASSGSSSAVPLF